MGELRQLFPAPYKMPGWAEIVVRDKGVDAAFDYLVNKKPDRWLEAEEVLVLIIGILLGFFLCQI